MTQTMAVLSSMLTNKATQKKTTVKRLWNLTVTIITVINNLYVNDCYFLFTLKQITGSILTNKALLTSYIHVFFVESTQKQTSVISVH